MLRRWAAAMALLVVVAGCAGAPVASLAGPPPRVVGTVTAGPVCPVERVPPDPQCAPRPVAGAVIVATVDAVEVGRATSAADGTYTLEVARTGTVVIAAKPVAGLMGTPAPVTVQLDAPSQTRRVDFSYDTGIR